MRNKIFLSIIRDNLKYTSLAAITKILFALSVTLVSYYLKVLFDSYERNQGELYSSMVFAGGIIILVITLSITSDFFKALYIKKTNESLKKKMTTSMMLNVHSMIKFKDTGKGISWFLNDADQIEIQAFENFINFIYMVTLVVSAFISILLLHWMTAVAAIIMLLLSLLIPKFVQKYIVQAQKLFSKANEEYTESIRDNIEGLALYFTGNALDAFQNNMQTTVVAKENHYFKYSMTQAKVSGIMLFVSLLSQIGLIIFTLYIVSLGYTTPGSVIGIASLSGNLFNGVQGVISSLTVFNAADTLFSKFQSEVSEKHEFNESIHEIQFDNVSLNYDENSIFSNFTYQFLKGEKYAIVGESGSGKTTLLKMMIGFIEPKSGQITVNGRDVKSINLNDYYARISYIDQTTYLLNGTIKDNILLGTNVSEDRLNEVINMAQLNQFINKLPQGLETQLYSNGVTISGGEKQRIALARALIKDSDFIFIDESTSQLNKKVREKIENTILSFKDVGIVYVSHNTEQQTLEKFDFIVESNQFKSH